jgi:hypothetical protein
MRNRPPIWLTAVRYHRRAVSPLDDRFDRWLRGAEERHLADLTFPQVSAGLRALSSAYVERRTTIAGGGPLDGAGKRAAFALFYAPLHFLLVREIVSALHEQRAGVLGGPAAPPLPLLIDLGCGTGAAGAAWASLEAPPPRVVGVDRHAWALAEAARTYREFGLRARTNELPEVAREKRLETLVERATGGDRLLIVEPVARGVAPWWDRWQKRIESAGGRGDEWRFRRELPPIVAKLDRAARLDHRELTARSLWLRGSAR